MKPLLILKTGTTLPEISETRGDFEDWISRGVQFDEGEVEVAKVYEGEALPDPAEISGVVITGSSALVTEKEDWSEQSAAWLPAVIEREIPVLGICYGHQLLAHALGGRVERNPRGREIGTVEVRLGADAHADDLLGSLPQTISVQVSHVESVVKLPAAAKHHGVSSRDLNQAFAFGSSAWGVQFHPEFDADIVRGYIQGRRGLLLAEGLDPDALLDAANDTSHGSDLLQRFGQLVRERGSRA